MFNFLDLHINNICKSDSEYKLEHSLAYKEHSSFSYTTMYSNIHDKYKHAIVPISLYRIHTRCTEKPDIDNHLLFMSRILRTRMQDSQVVREKRQKFFKKKKNGGGSTSIKTMKKTTPITFDNGTGRHRFMQNIIRKSVKTQIRIVHKSRPSLASILCPKRRIIRNLQKHVENL